MSSPPPSGTGASWPVLPPPEHTVVWSHDLTGIRDLAPARTDLRDHLRAAGHTEDGALDEVAERILLAADELTSNGVRHGNPPVALALATTGTPGTYLLLVTDRAAGRAPTPDPTRDPVDGGLGLIIIATYASAHGWWPDGDTKRVWALLPLQA